MTEQTLWGLLLIAYIVPFWLWQVFEYSKIEARKKLYPGRANEVQLEQRFNNRSLLWCGGLAAALGAWGAGWHPIGTAIVLSAITVVAFALRTAITRWSLLSNRLFRFWLASSVVWVLVVAAWYLVFSRTSDLLEHEFTLLAVFPPSISAVAVAAWKWAMRKG